MDTKDIHGSREDNLEAVNDMQRMGIARGAQALGTDGLLGTVQQVVVDQETGELRGLVVRGEAGMDYMLPTDRIESMAGNAVRFTLGRKDLAAQPQVAQPYDTGQVVPPGESEELEAVIIPGEEPGDTDLYVADMASADLTEAEDLAAMQDALMPTGERGKSGMGGLGRPIVLGALAATGAIFLGAGAVATYLLVRRNQQRNTLSARASRQASDLAARAGTMRDTLRAQGAATWADLNARANVWLPIAVAALAAWRDRAMERGGDLASSLRPRARQTATTMRANWRANLSPGWSPRQLSDQISERASDLSDQLAASWRQLSARATRANTGARKTARQATTSANKQVQQARASARRGVRRARRQARWFRNGILAGVVAGILYAPRPGRETRANLATTLRRIPMVDALLNSDTAASASAPGATGPRPRHADTRSPLGSGPRRPDTMGDTSEQPDAIPRNADDLVGPGI